MNQMYPHRTASAAETSQIVRSGWRIIVACLFVVCSTTLLTAAPLEYNRDIRPILAEQCFACHGADSASRKADLRLDVREAAVDFGAIVEGAPEESELIARILSSDPDLIMPPPSTKKSLTAEEKQLLRRWIKEGAEYQPHWSLIQPSRPALPEVQDKAWIKNDIDRFVLQRLEQAGLAPATRGGATHPCFAGCTSTSPGCPRCQPIPMPSKPIIEHAVKRRCPTGSTA